MLQFSIDRRADLADDLQLRLHISSLESSGTLVATLENGPIATGGVPVRQRERLAGRHVDRRGWVRLDISDALGDSGDLTVGLRGRDGASLSVSMSGSANPPELKEGYGKSSTVRRDDRKPREHQNRDRHREHDETPRAQRQRGR
jgi:hypothetical protein